MSSPTAVLSDMRAILSAEKIVRNRWLNLMGCQVGRLLLARALLWKRRRRWMKEITDIEQTLLRDGVVLIENFFDDDTFSKLLTEINKGEAQLVQQAPVPDKFGIARQQLTIHKKPEIFPLANHLFLKNDFLLHAVRLQEGWRATDHFLNTRTVLKYEKLEQVHEPMPVTSQRDAEVSSGDLHADTFHFVTKAFLTLNEMTTENSPYHYCYGSHQLTKKRIAWEYANSIKSNQYQDDYYNRVYAEQMAEMNLTPTPIVAKENTLIITDTFGFHFRGQMTKKGEIRRMLRLDFRSNPFRFS
jgi:hypothetical protein